MRKKARIQNQRLHIFKGVLLKCGNKERIYKYFLKLYKFLKVPTNIKGIPNALKKNPTLMLEAALEQSGPIFTYKRIVKAGRLYEIPVPISVNRATFMASSWIQKIAQKKTKEGHSTYYFIANEIINILRKKGATLEQLNAYTAEGLEKNIFKKLIRKKYPTVSRSRHLNAYSAVLSRINRRSIRKNFIRKGKQSTFFLMRLRKKHYARNYRMRKLSEKKFKLKKLKQTFFKFTKASTPSFTEALKAFSIKKVNIRTKSKGKESIITKTSSKKSIVKNISKLTRTKNKVKAKNAIHNSNDALDKKYAKFLSFHARITKDAKILVKNNRGVISKKSSKKTNSLKNPPESNITKKFKPIVLMTTNDFLK